MDRGFFITLAAVRRQMAAMPSDFYLLRLVHHHTGELFPAQPFWSAIQLTRGSMVRFLRQRNREGFDIYWRPYAGPHNAGYILLDLDAADPRITHAMRVAGHEPCVMLQTSPGRRQAWVRVSETVLDPALATALGRQLAHTYGGDPASTDWCHLGRLAGFTNQKPARRQPNGYAPWVRLLYAQPQLASQRAALIDAAQHRLWPPFLHRLRIPPRFPQPDGSIADLWIAKELLRCRVPVPWIQAILRLGSPGFPRRHGRPDDYLARTLRRAVHEFESARFLARPCVDSGPGVPG